MADLNCRSRWDSFQLTAHLDDFFQNRQQACCYSGKTGFWSLALSVGMDEALWTVWGVGDAPLPTYSSKGITLQSSWLLKFFPIHSPIPCFSVQRVFLIPLLVCRKSLPPALHWDRLLEKPAGKEGEARAADKILLIRSSWFLLGRGLDDLTRILAS